MTRAATLFDAEVVIGGYRKVVVPAGTRVSLGRGMIATITQAALDCDCNKGVYCPLNPQERMEYRRDGSS